MIRNQKTTEGNLRTLPTFVDILTQHAEKKPDETALIFLEDGEHEVASITFGELDKKSRTFAAGLRQHANKGDRVVLFFPSSYEFAIAFLGCMYAGVISVPLPIPGKRISEWIKLGKVLLNSGTSHIVTNEKICGKLKQNAERNSVEFELNILDYEKLIESGALLQEPVTGSDLAFLQYTSGSTGSPKGVVLTHDNLMENQILLEKGFRNYGKSIYCSWLPLFHDMGLIGNFMQALYIGQPLIFMAPNAFLQKPIRWLKAISDYKVRVSGAPNFAYDLCVERITDEAKSGLDLSTWEMAFNGAEPIRAKTLKRFVEAFKSCGFKEEHFYPCYGTAESTLIISGAEGKPVPMYMNVDRDLYEKGSIRSLGENTGKNAMMLVSSGKPLIENSIVIVDAEYKSQLPDLTVGEIWLTSPCNAAGYWNAPDASAEAFENKVTDSESDENYLNTGDLGFLDNGNIYITGRTKDLLIFNGRNIYPQDIEACSESSHPALKTGRCAACSLYIDKRERLILVHELNRVHAKKISGDEVFEAIRKAVFKEFTLPVYAIALIAPASIPMTSSGKIRRHSCRELYVKSELNLIHHWPET